ncbi:MAG: hemolysin family protein [Treponema sp.]|jgi:putative hemolysin|nr:hemolysin family protein [Treponema sp.]
MHPLPAVLTVFALIIVSGIFSLFDSAITFCRKTRLEKETGNLYRSVLKVYENRRDLSLACYLWINLLRITAAFITGMSVMRYFETAQISRFTIVLIIAASAFILGILAALLGEGLPKLISRIAPEKTAAILFLPVKILYFPLIPVIHPALKAGSFFRSVFRLEANENSMTEDELRNALMEGEKSGIVESKELTMVEGVFYLGDRPVSAFMTHRSEIEWLDVNAPYEEIKAKALNYRDQRCFLVTDGSMDEIAGAVYLEDIILDTAQPNPQGLRAIMKKAHFIPETMSALKAFESFKQVHENFLFVMDEYGGLAGVISIEVLVEEIVGKLSAPVQKEEPIIRQEDGSLLADGTLNIDDAASALSLAGLGKDGDFHTLAGFVLYLAGELPHAGDIYEYQGYRFKVMEMDGNRIGKLLISKIEE